MFEGKGVHKLPEFDATKVPGVDDSPYVHQHYPRALHKGKESLVVATPEAHEAALLEGWSETPGV